MSFEYTARSMGQRPHSALAIRHLNLFCLVITRGGSIAVVYSRPRLLFDYDFASDRHDENETRDCVKRVC